MRVDFYCEVGGKAPVLEWLREVRATSPKRYLVALAMLGRLRAQGSTLRPPYSKALGVGLFELRVEVEGVQLRIFYFFHGAGIAIAAHSLVKKSQRTPRRELETAQDRKRRFETSPERHRLEVELEDIERLMKGG